MNNTQCRLSSIIKHKILYFTYTIGRFRSLIHRLELWQFIVSRFELRSKILYDLTLSLLPHHNLFFQPPNLLLLLANLAPHSLFHHLNLFLDSSFHLRLHDSPHLFYLVFILILESLYDDQVLLLYFSYLRRLLLIQLGEELLLVLVVLVFLLFQLALEFLKVSS